MTAVSSQARPGAREVARRAAGQPSDWNLGKPSPTWPRPGLHWTGPIAIVASVAVSWFAFSGAQGEDGSVQFALFIGATSIMLMAWSFILSYRSRMLEPVFGGLDRMYRVHRWAGSLAVVAMWLHTSFEAEVEDGIPGASESVADAARGLAGQGQTMLYILVGISLLRWFPYRWWRWTHKLLGIPFAFACFHFYTAEKSHANGSAWGWWFGAFMVTGFVAYLARIFVRDSVAQGTPYRVIAIERQGTTTELHLAPIGKPLRHHAGQFAVLRLLAPGLGEPHSFTIASGPKEDELRFFIRDLGDWTAKIQRTDLIGCDAVVEGPYGHFKPLPKRSSRTVWIAGGVGITPFLSAIETLSPAAPQSRPLLLYSARDRADATAIASLERAADDGRIVLEVFASSQGRRFTAEALSELTGESGLGSVHVAVCGPASLVASASQAARRLGAKAVETERFDIRAGFGPDMSVTIEQLLDRT